jgi:hypothetical protein
LRALFPHNVLACGAHTHIRWVCCCCRYYQASKAFAVVDRAKQREEIDAMKAKFGVDSEKHDEKKDKKEDKEKK